MPTPTTPLKSRVVPANRRTRDLSTCVGMWAAVRTFLPWVNCHEIGCEVNTSGLALLSFCSPAQLDTNRSRRRELRSHRKGTPRHAIHDTQRFRAPRRERRGRRRHNQINDPPASGAGSTNEFRQQSQDSIRIHWHGHSRMRPVTVCAQGAQLRTRGDVGSLWDAQKGRS